MQEYASAKLFNIVIKTKSNQHFPFSKDGLSRFRQNIIWLEDRSCRFILSVSVRLCEMIQSLDQSPDSRDRSEVMFTNKAERLFITSFIQIIGNKGSRK